MKPRTLAVVLILGLLAACGDAGIFGTDLAGQAVSAPDGPPIEGRAGDVEFLLDDDVFHIERSANILLIALVLYLPFLIL